MSICFVPYLALEGEIMKKINMLSLEAIESLNVNPMSMSFLSNEVVLGLTQMSRIKATNGPTVQFVNAAGAQLLEYRFLDTKERYESCNDALSKAMAAYAKAVKGGNGKAAQSAQERIDSLRVKLAKLESELSEATERRNATHGEISDDSNVVIGVNLFISVAEPKLCRFMPINSVALSHIILTLDEITVKSHAGDDFGVAVSSATWKSLMNRMNFIRDTFSVEQVPMFNAHSVRFNMTDAKALALSYVKSAKVAIARKSGLVKQTGEYEFRTMDSDAIKSWLWECQGRRSLIEA